MGFFDSDYDTGCHKGCSDAADEKETALTCQVKDQSTPPTTEGKMKTQRMQKSRRSVKSNCETEMADLGLLTQLQCMPVGADMMGQPELTVVDNPLVALAELHAELYDNDHMTEERSKQTMTQKVIAIVREFKQNPGTVVKITLETVKEDRTLSKITFQVHPHRIVEWKRKLLGKVAVILNERELKKLHIKAGKLTAESRLLGLTLDEAITSTTP